MGATILTGAWATETLIDKAVLSKFAKTNAVVQNMPFMSIPTGTRSYGYERIKTLPTTGHRSINGNYTVSNPVIERVSTQICLFGGEFNIDVNSANIDMETIYTETFAMSSSYTLQKEVFDGDSSAGEIAGLNELTTAESQYGVPGGIGTYPNGFPAITDATQARTFLMEIRKAFKKVDGDKPDGTLDGSGYNGLVIYMDQDMAAVIEKAISLANYQISWQAIRDGSYIQSAVLFGVPVIFVTTDKDRNDILAFDETVGGNSDCASIYIVNLSAEKGCAFVGWGANDIASLKWYPTVRDRALYNYLYDIPIGFIMKRSTSAYRLYGIRNA